MNHVHLGCFVVTRARIQDMRYAHEGVLLAHVDVPDATTQVHLVIEVDSLHKYKCRREGGGSRRSISDG